MSGQPDCHTLPRQAAVPEERMNAVNERYDKGRSLLREDMAKRDAEFAKREMRLLFAIAGLNSMAVVTIGFLIRIPRPA